MSIPIGYSAPLPGTPRPSIPRSTEQGILFDGKYRADELDRQEDGIYGVKDPSNPQSDKTLYVLPSGNDTSPVFVPTLAWASALMRLNGADYLRIKEALGITDNTTQPNANFIKKAENVAQQVSYENYLKTIQGLPSMSWEVALNQGYGTGANAGVGGPRTTRTTSITGIDSAFAEFQNYSREYLGYELSKKEAREYQKKLNVLEKKRFTTTTAGEGFTNIMQGSVGREEREQLALDIIGRRISVEGIDDPGKVGGLIGTAVRNIRGLSSDFGLSINPQEVRDYALQSLSSQTGLETIRTKFNNLARVQYQGLVPYLDQGLSVKDISSSYMSKKAQLLELNPAEITINDTDIQRALTGEKLKPLYEFEMDLRKNPQWEYTNNAREEASGYAYTILRDFGLI